MDLKWFMIGFIVDNHKGNKCAINILVKSVINLIEKVFNKEEGKKIFIRELLTSKLLDHIPCPAFELPVSDRCH